MVEDVPPKDVLEQEVRWDMVALRDIIGQVPPHHQARMLDLLNKMRGKVK